MIVEPLPIFSDNYVWCLRSENNAPEAWVIDPGDAAPVRRALADRHCRLGGILVTHWHPDHIGGIADLLAEGPVPVIGPLAEAARIPQLTRRVSGGEQLDLPMGRAEVIAVPGHTLGHIAFAISDWLFCGDTLFSAGCGRLFEGTPAQMWDSLSRLNSYPAATRIACTHEYTLSNLRFARAVEPDNPAIVAYQAAAEALRSQDLPTLPSTLARERLINPFLRCERADVRSAAAQKTGEAINTSVACFAALRSWKDNFR